MAPKALRPAPVVERFPSPLNEPSDDRPLPSAVQKFRAEQAPLALSPGGQAAAKNLDKAEEMSYKTVQAEPANSTYLDTYA